MLEALRAQVELMNTKRTEMARETVAARKAFLTNDREEFAARLAKATAAGEAGRQVSISWHGPVTPEAALPFSQIHEIMRQMALLRNEIEEMQQFTGPLEVGR